METSKHTQEIIALGKKLVSEFSAHDRRDITLNWMAHHLSALIVSAEQETDETKKADLNIRACETILTIWQSRNDFPRGTRPLSGLSEAAEVIRSLRTEDPETDYLARHRELQQNSAWGNFAESLRSSNDTIYELTMYASIGEDLLAKEKEWAEFPGMLSDEEKELLQYIDEVIRRDENPIRIVYTSADKTEEKPKSEKIDRIFSKIDKLLKQQMGQFEVLKQSVLKGRELADDSDEWENEFNDFLD
jgi:hypothetical protein